MYLDWILPLVSLYVNSGFWSYFVMPVFCLACVVVIVKIVRSIIDVRSYL